MKVILFIISFCVLYISVYSWTAMIPYKETKLNHGGHCYSDSQNIGAMKKFEEKRIEGQCSMAACLETKDISLWGCGVFTVEPPCYVVPGNVSKPFPKCCFEVKCPEHMTEDEERLNAL